MKKYQVMLVIGLFLLLWNVGDAKDSKSEANTKDPNPEWTKSLSDYKCLEVEKFTVDRNDYTSTEKERAAAIPDERLANLQHKIVGEIFRDKTIGEVTKTDQEPCKGKALVFGGQVTDFKPGNQAVRAFVGFGAGKQKFEVQCFIKDKESGKVLAQKQVVDRKMAGWGGGSDEKGESDFAEKVAAFVKAGK